MLSLAWSAMLAGQAQGKRKTRLPRRTFSTFGFFLFLPSVTPAPPWSIKGRAGHPTKGTDRFDTQHTTKQQLSSWRPFDLSIRDLGLVPLSTVCTPYYEPFSVLITRAAANWAKISLSFSLFFLEPRGAGSPNYWFYHSAAQK